MSRLNDKCKMLDRAFELILCPFCGARLNRIMKDEGSLLPTSCEICGKHRLVPKCILVCEVKL
jgi:transcription elongation factor Elf1